VLKTTLGEDLLGHSGHRGKNRMGTAVIGAFVLGTDGQVNDLLFQGQEAAVIPKRLIEG